MSRPLGKRELRNLEFINSFTSKSTIVFITENGFKKSVTDATAQIREVFKKSRIHNYLLQNQGLECKKQKRAFIYSKGFFEEVIVSMYRPETKSGDPRFWINDLKSYISPDSVISIIPYNRKLYFVDLSSKDLSKEFSKHKVFSDCLNTIQASENLIANELLAKIYKFHKRGWIKSAGKGSKGVGETIEALLGIPPNSSKNPDYKGIELKSGRYKKGSQNKCTLFTKVANWELSKIKSSMEMLNTYGYKRGPIKRLTCTVSTLKPNTQGLRLEIDEKRNKVNEVYVGIKKEKCLVWPIDSLLETFTDKHKETFWIEAEVKTNRNGKEEFLYSKITHTKAPSKSNFIALLSTGIITLDHLISKGPDRKPREQGPSFRIMKKDLHLLFPKPVEIVLRDYKEK